MGTEAVVKFEYDAVQHDELTLKVGDVIKNVRLVDEGWCEGTLDGKIGVFPDNFVELREAPKPPGTGGAPVRDMLASKKVRRAKVAFSYAADNIDELSLELGQVVEVIAEEEEGWWKGRLGNKEGVFPSNFVEIIEEDSALPQTTPSASNLNEPDKPPDNAPPKHAVMGQAIVRGFNPQQARAMLKKPSNSSIDVKKPVTTPSALPTKPSPPPTKNVPPHTVKHFEKAKVMFDYDAQNEDELTIRTGEIVEILNKNTDNDGWWEVRLGERNGMIPDNFVEVLPTSPPPPARQPLESRPTPPPPTQQETKQIPSKPPAPQVAVKRKPPAPEPGKKPHKPEHKPEPPVTLATTVDKHQEDSEFDVPSTEPLDNSAIKNRPKKTARPPSRSNLIHHNMDEGGSHSDSPEPHPPPVEKPHPPPVEKHHPPPMEKPTPAPAVVDNVPPWKRELEQKKKRQQAAKPIVKKPVVTPSKPPTPSKAEVPATSTKPAMHKFEEPEKVQSKPPPVTHKEIHTAQSVAPPITQAPPSTTATANEWKEAYENLREEFEKFKKYVVNELTTLTDDLDKEIKERAALKVDIERLKKSRGFPQ